jgi:hypothetical protein
MKYLIDKNIFTRNLKNNIDRRLDLCITQDVIDESGLSQQEIKRIKDLNIQVVKFNKIHYEKLKEVIDNHGDNLNLINLFLGEGTADIMMLAYILGENETDKSLFPEKFVIVTKDIELTRVATSYGIECRINIA